MTTLTACSGSVSQPNQFNYTPETSTLKLASNERLAAKCDGLLTETGRVALPNLGISLSGYACIVQGTGELPTDLWVDDATGEEVDPAVEMNLDRVKFKMEKSAIDPLLQERIEKTSADELIGADVWFAVDETDLPLKDELLQESQIAEETTRLDARIRSQVNVFVDSISSHNAFQKAAGKRSIEIASKLSSPAFGAPRFSVRATGEDLKWLGNQDLVTLVSATPGPGTASAPPWYDVDGEAWLDNQNPGLDGTGITVGMLELGRIDSTSTLTGFATGSCVPTDGNGSANYLCHCPTTSYVVQDEHSRAVTSILRNNVLCSGADCLGGMADDVRTINANIWGGCTSNGPDQYVSAVRWATANGASVLNQSAEFGPGSPANSLDLYLDYTAVHYPYPMIVAAAGNSGYTQRVQVNLRNGLVVGAADDHGSSDRAQATMTDFSSAKNYVVPPVPVQYGMELPHISAPGNNIAYGGDVPGEVEYWNGTSYASPQVAGLAASLQEFNTALKTLPEAMMAGLMVSASRNLVGAWPLDINDTEDDRDGTGLVDSLTSLFVLAPASHHNGGAPAAAFGYDNGTLQKGTTPAGSYYPETWNASVGAGQRLRVVVTELGTNSCNPNSGGSQCTVTDYPWVNLYIFDGANVAANGFNAANNYSPQSVVNTSGATKNYQIKLWLANWNSVTSSYFGVAWVAQ